MRYPIKISRPWRLVFSPFGFSAQRSYVELDEQAVCVHFGTANEPVPLAEITSVERRHWPFYFGLGPSGGVSYVGSTEGVVQIDLVRPRAMSVWGPFCTSRARCLVVSLEHADQFIDDLRAALDKASKGDSFYPLREPYPLG